jgi:hypothetical protein
MRTSRARTVVGRKGVCGMWWPGVSRKVTVLRDVAAPALGVSTTRE